MDNLFDIINTIHELSQKHSEFNEEIQNLQLTVVTVSKALQNIRNDRNRQDTNIYTDVLSSQLTEAKDLLQEINQKKKTKIGEGTKTGGIKYRVNKIIDSVKHMLPGSDL